MPSSPWRHPRPPAPSLHEVDALIAELEAYLAQDAAERTGDGEALLQRARALIAATRPRDPEPLVYRPRQSRRTRGDDRDAGA